MGSLPRLKIKDEIHYRKGSTNTSNNCEACMHFKENATKTDFMPPEDRCVLIGFGKSLRYRVRKDHTCDRQAMSAEWRRRLEALRSNSVVRNLCLGLLFGAGLSLFLWEYQAPIPKEETKQMTAEERVEYERRARYHGFIARDGRKVHFLTVAGWPGDSPVFIRDGKPCRF